MVLFAAALIAELSPISCRATLLGELRSAHETGLRVLSAYLLAPIFDNPSLQERSVPVDDSAIYGSELD